MANTGGIEGRIDRLFQKVDSDSGLSKRQQQRTSKIIDRLEKKLADKESRIETRKKNIDRKQDSLDQIKDDDKRAAKEAKLLAREDRLERKTIDLEKTRSRIAELKEKLKAAEEASENPEEPSGGVDEVRAQPVGDAVVIDVGNRGESSKPETAIFQGSKLDFSSRLNSLGTEGARLRLSRDKVEGRRSTLEEQVKVATEIENDLKSGNYEDLFEKQTKLLELGEQELEQRGITVTDKSLSKLISDETLTTEEGAKEFIAEREEQISSLKQSEEQIKSKELQVLTKKRDAVVEKAIEQGVDEAKVSLGNLDQAIKDIQTRELDEAKSLQQGVDSARDVLDRKEEDPGISRPKTNRIA